jgi:hypothetical protein
MSLLPEFNGSSDEHISALLFGRMFKVEAKEQDGFFKNGNPRMRKVEKLIPVRGFGLPTKGMKKAKKDGVFCVDEKTLSDLLKGLE